MDEDENKEDDGAAVPNVSKDKNKTKKPIVGLFKSNFAKFGAKLK